MFEFLEALWQWCGKYVEKDRGRGMEGEAKVWELSQENVETGQVDKVLNYLEKGSKSGEGDRFKSFEIVK